MKLLKLVPDDTNISFLKWRVPFFAISVLLIAVSWALVLTKGLNYGVDFAGGARQPHFQDSGPDAGKRVVELDCGAHRRWRIQSR